MQKLATRFLLGSCVMSVLIRSHSGSRDLRDSDPARSGRSPVRPAGGLRLPYRSISHREVQSAGYMAERAARPVRIARLAGCATDRDPGSGWRGDHIRETASAERSAESDAHEEHLQPSDGHRKPATVAVHAGCAPGTLSGRFAAEGGAIRSVTQ